MNEKTKHTPGPWKTYGLAIYTEAKRKHWVSPRDPRQSLIANVRDNDPEDPEAVDYNAPEYAEAAANARLIASAPELLEALEKALPWLDFMDETDAADDRIGDVISVTRAAIAKARGEKGGAL